MTHTGKEPSASGNGDSKRYRLLVESIGTAGAAVVTTLRRVRSSTDADLAALLYRAPSVLVDNLDADKCHKLRSVLEKTGLVLRILEPGDTFEPGTGDFEVALAVKDVSNLTSVIEETMRVVGVDVETAKKIVCASPALLLGGISAATVASLKQRYGALGVDLDVSRSADANFDIAVETQDVTMQAAISALLRGAGASVSVAARHQLMATGLNVKATERVWPELSRTASKVQVLNRDLQRFDVRLERAPDSAEVRSWLTGEIGMPERLVAKALQRTPLILAENVSGTRMLDLLQGASKLGAHATGVLLALQMFSMKLQPGGDRANARAWVEAIGGREAAAELMQPNANTLQGPFTKLQARWLQFELRKHRIQSHITERDVR